MRGEEDGDRGAELHGETTGRRVHGQSVTEDGHDVVAVSGQADDDHTSTKGEHPSWRRRIRGGGPTSVPNLVDGGKRSDGVGDIVGTVGERGGTGGHDLKEGVQVLGLVGVLVRSLVHSLQPLSHLIGATGLHGVDVDTRTVGKGADDLVSEDDPQVLRQPPESLDLVLVLLNFVEGNLGSLAESRTLVTMDLGLGISLGFGLATGRGGRRAKGYVGGLVVFVISSVNSVVGNVGHAVLDRLRSGSLPEERAVKEVVPPQGVILLDDCAVHEWQPEQSGQDSDDQTGEHNGEGDR